MSGRRHGAASAPNVPKPSQRTEAAATSQLVRALDDIGCVAELVTRDWKRQVLLRHCPLPRGCQEHREVVCSVHLGLMRGLLAELEAQRLDPSSNPAMCGAPRGPPTRRRTKGVSTVDQTAGSQRGSHRA